MFKVNNKDTRMMLINVWVVPITLINPLSAIVALI